MDAQEAIDLGREAIRACMMIGGPILVISLLVGLAIGMMQAMTQVQDQTVSFVPKLLIVMVGIAICLPWLSDRMIEFSHDVLSKPMMMAHGTAPQTVNHPVDHTVNHSVNFVPVAWPGTQPHGSIAPLNVRESNQTPAWFDHTTEQPDIEVNKKSPFQLPHYRFARKPTDDLEG
ncbi:flagellar biosynthetic protein FliQ [Mariniblastus sp.]|nr:flagellar biosynthetic protein FliQ [Mariniblastus sp.]